MLRDSGRLNRAGLGYPPAMRFAIALVLAAPVGCALDGAGSGQREDDGATAVASSGSATPAGGSDAGPTTATSTATSSADAAGTGSGGDGAGAGTGGDTSGAAGGGGSTPNEPDCGNGVIEAPDEECDGGWPCDADCRMQCPPGWVEGDTTHTCYGGDDSDWSYYEIGDGCDSLRGQGDLPDDAPIDPATPEQKGDLAAVTTVCGSDLNEDGCWIGADDRVAEDSFVWRSADLFTYPGGTSPWGEGEPNDDGDDEEAEDCLEVWVPDGAATSRPLNDDRCDNAQHVVCEIAPPGDPAR